MRKPQLISIIVLLLFSTGYAQQENVATITNVAFSCPGGVTVTYNLTCAQPVDSVSLYYSPNKCDWLFAKTVTGDHYNQAAGTGKTLFWDNFTDKVRWGKFYFKMVVPQPEPADLPDPLFNWSDDYRYVGTFHRNSQTGERVIYAGHTGVWTVTIEDPTGTGSFIRIDDGSGDAGLGSRLTAMYVDDTWVDPEPYKVTSAITSVSGTGDILFRVGMASENNTGAPRYGRIKITWNKSGTPTDHYIYVRQGEQADNVSTTSPHDAVKWSPYNLGNYNDPSQYGNGGFVDYPTKAGYFYQWGYGTTPITHEVPRPYPPYVTTLVPAWLGDYNNALYTLGSVSPAGYKVPSGGWTGTSEQESLLYNASTNSSVSTVAAGLWGYYADGFFDRRKIEATAEGSSAGSNAVVSKGNDDVAYIGRLVFNTTTHASLFLPAAGFRNYSDGSLNGAGSNGFYWSSTPYTTDTDSAYVLYFYSSLFDVGSGSYGRAYGRSVRCVADE